MSVTYKETPKTDYNKKYFFGTRKSDKAKIWLTAPSWDCGWYWSFGYLGNKNEHYHLDYWKRDNKNLYDTLIEDFDLAENVKTNLWVFCELVATAYTLKETAEVLGRGGSHYTSNPCKTAITNHSEVVRINTVVLPSIFTAIKNIFEMNQNE